MSIRIQAHDVLVKKVSGLNQADRECHFANTTAVVASYNVQINISRIKDQAFVERCEKEVTEILKRQEVLISDVDGSANIYLT
jgi:formiminotetrahydrofolate cyclodeaminase